LSGQDYVDEYATKKAESFPSADATHVATLEERTNGGGNGHAAPRRSSADVLANWSAPA
jgi:hypothetical protein